MTYTTPDQLPLVLTFEQVADVLAITGTADTKRRNVMALVTRGVIALVDDSRDVPASMRRITKDSLCAYIGVKQTDQTGPAPHGTPTVRNLKAVSQ